MNEKENSKKELWTILGLLALVVVLILCVKLIFAGLEAVLPEPTQPPAQSQQMDASSQSGQTDVPAPSFCPHCGDGLPESFQWGQFCPWCGEKVE